MISRPPSASFGFESRLRLAALLTALACAGQGKAAEAPAQPTTQVALAALDAPAKVDDPLGGLQGKSKAFAGRRPAARAKEIVAAGGSPGSERAVESALNWLARHQLESGAWSCDHGQAPGHVGAVNDAGAHRGQCGSTGLALLALLGAGDTHLEGARRKEVRLGLEFLKRTMKRAPGGGDLRGGGSLYDHGIATIALCEAYGSSGDPEVGDAAQAALDFIRAAQDKTGGGWRYVPGQAGDASVLGWQVQALACGRLVGLKVDPNCDRGAAAFLDQVQTEGGANYGYTLAGAASPAMTAVGLLSRLHLGWKRDERALEKGVEYLAKLGPVKGDMYHNFYATQVLKRVGGDPWKTWNAKLRDALVDGQVAVGEHAGEKGSWTPDRIRPTAHQGGRHVESCLAALTLEVYYRYAAP